MFGLQSRIMRLVEQDSTSSCITPPLNTLRLQRAIQFATSFAERLILQKEIPR